MEVPRILPEETLQTRLLPYGAQGCCLSIAGIHRDRTALNQQFRRSLQPELKRGILAAQPEPGNSGKQCSICSADNKYITTKISNYGYLPLIKKHLTLALKSPVSLPELGEYKKSVID
jgi:hypothetical protein